MDSDDSLYNGERVMIKFIGQSALLRTFFFSFFFCFRLFVLGGPSNNKINSKFLPLNNSDRRFTC